MRFEPGKLYRKIGRVFDPPMHHLCSECSKYVFKVYLFISFEVVSKYDE